MNSYLATTKFCKTLISLVLMLSYLGLGNPHISWAAQTDPHSFETQWGSYGTNPGQFYWFDYHYSHDIAIDSNDNVLITEARASESITQVFTNNGDYSSTRLLGSDYLVWSAAINSADHLYFSVLLSTPIYIFDAAGTYLDEWPVALFIDTIDIDINDRVVVLITDPPTINQVHIYDAAGDTLLNQFGSTGTGNDQFTVPMALTTDSQGNIYINDTDYDWDIEAATFSVIKKFDADGNYLSQWGGSVGDGDGEIGSFASDMAVDSQDNVYILDTSNHRIQKFDSAGNYLTQWGSAGSSEGQFEITQNIAIDSNDNIFVTDKSADISLRRVQKFAPPADTEIKVTAKANQSETNTSTSVGSTSKRKSSKPSIIQIPQLSIPEFGGLFVNPIEQTAQYGKNIGVFVPQHTIGFDSFLSAFIDSAQQLMAKELGVAGNAIKAGDGDGLLKISYNHNNYWQIGDIYNLWYKAHQRNADKPSAVIIPELQQQNSIIYLEYNDVDLVTQGNLGQSFSETQLQIAFSTDGKNWQILSNSVVDPENNTVAAISRVGGYYMIVAIESSLH